MTVRAVRAWGRPGHSDRSKRLPQADHPRSPWVPQLQGHGQQVSLTVWLWLPCPEAEPGGTRVLNPVSLGLPWRESRHRV